MAPCAQCSPPTVCEQPSTRRATQFRESERVQAARSHAERRALRKDLLSSGHPHWTQWISVQARAYAGSTTSIAPCTLKRAKQFFDIFTVVEVLGGGEQREEYATCILEGFTGLRGLDAVGPQKGHRRHRGFNVRAHEKRRVCAPHEPSIETYRGERGSRDQFRHSNFHRPAQASLATESLSAHLPRISPTVRSTSGIPYSWTALVSFWDLMTVRLRVSRYTVTALYFPKASEGCLEQARTRLDDRNHDTDVAGETSSPVRVSRIMYAHLHKNNIQYICRSDERMPTDESLHDLRDQFWQRSCGRREVIHGCTPLTAFLTIFCSSLSWCLWPNRPWEPGDYYALGLRKIYRKATITRTVFPS